MLCCCDFFFARGFFIGFLMTPGLQGSEFRGMGLGAGSVYRRLCLPARRGVGERQCQRLCIFYIL